MHTIVNKIPVQHSTLNRHLLNRPFWHNFSHHWIRKSIQSKGPMCASTSSLTQPTLHLGLHLALRTSTLLLLYMYLASSTSGLAYPTLHLVQPTSNLVYHTLDLAQHTTSLVYPTLHLAQPTSSLVNPTLHLACVAFSCRVTLSIIPSKTKLLLKYLLRLKNEYEYEYEFISKQHVYTNILQKYNKE